MNYLDRIGTVIRKRRNELGLSQDEVAVRGDLNRGHYSDVENGKRRISVVTLKRIAEALETKSWALLKEAEK